MAVVLRLLGLNTNAGSGDIRRFFEGLHIPEAGVHIIGGDLGEAFILFSTEKDGQLAMRRSGKVLNGSTITLRISSVQELRHKIMSRLKEQKSSATENKHGSAATHSLDHTALLLSLIGAIQSLQSNSQVTPSHVSSAASPAGPTLDQRSEPFKRLAPTSDRSPTMICQTVPGTTSSSRPDDLFDLEVQQKRRMDTCQRKPGFLCLYGLPGYVTKREICKFFRGLRVLEVIINVKLGQELCCLVKLASAEEAEEGLKCNRRSMGEFVIKVRLASEKTWLGAMGQVTNAFLKAKRNAPSEARRDAWCEKESSTRSPVKRSAEDWALSGSPKRQHSSSVLSGTEHCVMIQNLSRKITKTEIKHIFHCPDIPNARILHLLDKWRQRTSTVFIVFDRAEDYVSTMNMDGCRVGSQVIDVSSITMEKMYAMLRCKKAESSAERAQPCRKQPHAAQTCLYMRNFPADVTKSDIKVFFGSHCVNEEDLTLLTDSNGNGVGEAIAQFQSEIKAKNARALLHGRVFLGARILITSITSQQKDDILR
ncbi:RNA binding motif protein 12Ba [Chanos chanos]|uniref:RNA binding motif protein 12Ba n=1 Tax=Chanos chanos TaxID=29144 RepID=A0A6J2WBJ2_CHACN|nr:RNA-binding protein 12B-like [Chanos chanos]